jgi:hypothetical protein
MRRNSIQEHVPWNLANHISNRPGGGSVIELEPEHVEVLFHPAHDWGCQLKSNILRGLDLQAVLILV